MPTLEDYDDDFTTAPAAPSRGGYVKVEDLKDGKYTVQLIGGEYKLLNGSPICELKLQVFGGEFDGSKFSHTYFITNADGSKNENQLSQLKADLLTLGADTPNWTVANNRRFSTMLPLALIAMKGVRFHATKKANVSAKNGKTYHNFYINKRDESDGMPAKFGAAQLIPEPDPFS